MTNVWKRILSTLLIAVVILAFIDSKLYAASFINNNTENNNIKEEYSNVYRYKQNQNKEIALTFDDGPHPIYTEIILDILKEYNIKATFFMIGENVLNYTDVALRVKSEGHEIGNHTVQHLTARCCTEAELVSDMVNCAEIIYQKLGVKPCIVRPPEGAIVTSVLRICSKINCSVILWNVDTRDWAHTSPQNIYKNVIENTDSGDIILMHDYIGKNSPTPEALRMIIPRLIDDGYSFVTVSELIKADE